MVIELKGILGVLVGLLVLLAIFYYAASMSVLTVGGIILIVIALMVGVPSAVLLLKIISNGK